MVRNLLAGQVPTAAEMNQFGQQNQVADADAQCFDQFAHNQSLQMKQELEENFSIPLHELTAITNTDVVREEQVMSAFDSLDDDGTGMVARRDLEQKLQAEGDSAVTSLVTDFIPKNHGVLVIRAELLDTVKQWLDSLPEDSAVRDSTANETNELNHLRLRAEKAEAGLQVQEKFVKSQETTISKHQQDIAALKDQLKQAQEEAELSALGLSQLGATFAEEREVSADRIKDLEAKLAETDTEGVKKQNTELQEQLWSAAVQGEVQAKETEECRARAVEAERLLGKEKIFFSFDFFFLLGEERSSRASEANLLKKQNSELNKLKTEIAEQTRCTLYTHYSLTIHAGATPWK